MNKNVILSICEAYDLGVPKGAVSAVRGGLIHKMWRLETVRGTYAIKELNLKIQDLDPNISSENSIQQAYALTESIAQAFLDIGIPAVAALRAGNELVAKISDKLVIVFEWVEGKSLSVAAAPKDQAFLIGKIMAKMHKANLELPGLNMNPLNLFSNAHWELLFEKFLGEFPDSTSWLAKELVLDWNQKAEGIVKKLERNMVLGHGDIDQKNVIWKDSQSPFIIDWESAGRVNPGLELMDAALNWGGLVSGDVNEDSIKAVLDGYKSEGGEILESGAELMSACIIKWLPWLEFNIQRATDPASTSEERELGFSQTQNTSRNLKLIAENSSRWAGLVG
jgi:thiamine kinase-like enzyme